MTGPTDVPPPLPPAEDDDPPSPLAVTVLLVLSIALLVSKSGEISDAWNGPLRLTEADVRRSSPGTYVERWAEVKADEAEGTGFEQTTRHVLKVGPLPLPAGQDGARLAVVRTGQAYLAAYLPSGVAPEKAAGKVLSGIVKPWPASLSRPEALAPWVLDTTADEPSWFVGALVAGFAGICAWQLAKAVRRKLARR